jgi:hypothetical protein
LEITNYKSLEARKKWKKVSFDKNISNLVWKKWVKAKYLYKINQLIQKNKKYIIANFLRNYDKIIKSW